MTSGTFPNHGRQSQVSRCPGGALILQYGVPTCGRDRGADRFRLGAVARALPTGSPGRFFQEGLLSKLIVMTPYFRPQETAPTDLMPVAIAHDMRSICVGDAQPWQ